MSGIITSGKLVLTDSEGNNDAFGRIRISEPHTLFEIHHVFSKEGYLMDEYISGSGTSTLNSGSYVSLAVTSSGVGKTIRQSYEYVPYQPGKSKLMLFTGILEVSGGVANSVSRIGCFDSTTEKTSSGTKAGNGHFFELDGTTMSIVERLNDSDTKVAQASWNVDTLDGNGPSALTVSTWNKAHIFAIEQEWLGVGMVRLGVFLNGTLKECHRFNHSGLGTPASTALTAPYTRTAKLPVRYEISSSSSADAEMRMICSAVLSEGGFEPVGRVNGISNTAATNVVFNSSGVFTPICSIRLKESEPENRASIVLKNVHLLNITTSKFVQFHLYLLPDDTALTGESFSDVDSTNSVAQYDSSATAVNLTNAVSVGSGFVEIETSEEYPYQSYLNSPLINSAIVGKSRIMCLAAFNLTSATAECYGGFEWIEIK